MNGELEGTRLQLAQLEREEVSEFEEKIGPARDAYDQVRVAWNSKSPAEDYPAASSFATPDDFLNAAEALEEGVVEAGASMAGLAKQLGDALDAAAKEYNEATDSMKVVQKAANDRARAAGQERPTFVDFRRAVRVTFGRTSREYRELLDRRGEGGDDEE